MGRALELGVNFFDTAPAYGDGVSEEHLGETLEALGARCLVATKVRLGAEGLADPAAAVTRSLETSLRRLRRDRVDLLQLHDPVRVAREAADPQRTRSSTGSCRRSRPSDGPGRSASSG